MDNTFASVHLLRTHSDLVGLSNLSHLRPVRSVRRLLFFLSSSFENSEERGLCPQENDCPCSPANSSQIRPPKKLTNDVGVCFRLFFLVKISHYFFFFLKKKKGEKKNFFFFYFLGGGGGASAGTFVAKWNMSSWAPLEAL